MASPVGVSGGSRTPVACGYAGAGPAAGLVRRSDGAVRWSERWDGLWDEHGRPWRGSTAFPGGPPKGAGRCSATSPWTPSKGSRGVDFRGLVFWVLLCEKSDKW
ncbi:hypothetical protein GCM10009872_21090 [Actinopolymorpha rutila]